MSVVLLSFLSTTFLLGAYRNLNSTTDYTPSAPQELDDDKLEETEEAKTSFIPIPSTESKLYQYFSCLYSYSPYNSCGSCSIISLAKCLSYFDTTYNDNIIPEKYERNQGDVTTISQAVSKSPGVLRRSFPKCNPDTKGLEEENYTDAFYQYVQANKDVDFQMYLIDHVNRYLGIEEKKYTCGCHMESYNGILQRMKNDGLGIPDISFSFIQETLSSTIKKDETQNKFKEYIKENIDSQNPVVLHLWNDDASGKTSYYHSVVAYDYDDAGNIYANFEYYKSSAHEALNFSDYYIKEAGVFNIDSVEEVHSDNYPINGTTLCGWLAINHTHHYLDHYKYLSDEYHTAYCCCGESVIDSHSIKTLPKPLALTYCIWCGYVP